MAANIFTLPAGVPFLKALARAILAFVAHEDVPVVGTLVGPRFGAVAALRHCHHAMKMTMLRAAGFVQPVETAYSDSSADLPLLQAAAHPVVVRLGGLEYVRSIQKVNEDESLTFFCAIDEGIVLTVARGVDLVHNLEETFAYVRARIGEPELVLGCDCLLRHLEIEQKDLVPQVSDILQQNGVIGFATYGEQYNAMHVNQTFTGVAIGAAGNV